MVQAPVHACVSSKRRLNGCAERRGLVAPSGHMRSPGGRVLSSRLGQRLNLRGTVSARGPGDEGGLLGGGTGRCLSRWQQIFVWQEAAEGVGAGWGSCGAPKNVCRSGGKRVVEKQSESSNLNREHCGNVAEAGFQRK